VKWNSVKSAQVIGLHAEPYSVDISFTRSVKSIIPAAYRRSTKGSMIDSWRLFSRRRLRNTDRTPIRLASNSNFSTTTGIRRKGTIEERQNHLRLNTGLHLTDANTKAYPLLSSFENGRPIFNFTVYFANSLQVAKQYRPICYTLPYTSKCTSANLLKSAI